MSERKNSKSASDTKKQGISEEIINSKQRQKELNERAIQSLVDHVESKLESRCLSKNGRKGIEKLFNEFEYDDIIDAIDISASRYLTYDSDDKQNVESVAIYVRKIGGILNLKNRPPIDAKIAYVKGICRNRFHYWDERRGTQILYEYVSALRNHNYSEDDIIQDFEEEVIPKAKYLSNWSQWHHCMEGWTADLLSYAKAEKLKNEQTDKPQISEPKINESKYIAEKRKGGENSYQAYKPLRDKVEELCKAEMKKKTYKSANQLCNNVADIIEEKHPELLNSFQPYKNNEYEGADWKRPTFYGWCNGHYKAYK